MQWMRLGMSIVLQEIQNKSTPSLHNGGGWRKSNVVRFGCKNIYDIWKLVVQLKTVKLHLESV